MAQQTEQFGILVQNIIKNTPSGAFVTDDEFYTPDPVSELLATRPSTADRASAAYMVADALAMHAATTRRDPEYALEPREVVRMASAITSLLSGLGESGTEESPSGVAYITIGDDLIEVE